MGESSGNIQYYVIDNDVDVDTDLSGGKNDDADNKGTASYRMGRPYAVPMGNKRVTIMRLSLLKNDGSEIDSRQIRITREFITPSVDVDAPGVIIKDPQTTFNLSSEDKARLDKLQNLVKNVPEAERKTLQRFIDQLGDIWYDRADRAQTLLEFSHAVDGNTNMTPELKARILEQVSLIYTQGEQDAQEKTLARRMIADFLAKSTYKKDVFGDGTDENQGLLGQIIDNPEYFEQNKAIVQKIYDEYVKFDTQISDDAKAIIKDKLTVLIGQPTVKPPVNPEIEVKTPGIWQNIKNAISHFNINNLFSSIIFWIIVAVIGLIGLIIVVMKFVGGKKDNQSGHNSHGDSHGLPTVPDDNHHGPDWIHQDSEHHDDHGLPTIPTNVAGHDDHSTPDWLKEPESSFGGEDILSKEIKNAPPATSSAHDTVPDWLHSSDSHEEPAAQQSTHTPVKSSET